MPDCSALRLPFEFDQAHLREDLARVGEDEWSPHYNERDFGGVWRGVALRSLSGRASDVNAGPPGAEGFRDTPLLDRCPYFRDVLARFRCPVKSVRLLSLEPGSHIREHVDGGLRFEEGEARLHIPIRTNREVEFVVAGGRIQLEEGGCYYVNVHLPHRVSNGGREGRVHLVIDVLVDGWLREMFSRAAEVIHIEPETRPRLEPAGLIFHMSRCGSTLVSRMLGASPRAVSVSEPPAVDGILQSRDSAVERLRDWTRPFGGPLFVKLDSWHIHSLPTLREAFPSTPWVFLYRDPLEVVVSHLRRPGMQAVPGAMDPAILGLTLQDVIGLCRTEWCIRVLEGFLEAALRHRADPRGLLVNYRELPKAVFTRIAPHFGFEPTPEDRSLMSATAEQDAKNPDRRFEPDAESKRREGAALEGDPALRRLRSIYDALEDRRGRPRPPAG